jgi:pyridoxal phosphate enzyme (YggS family)
VVDTAALAARLAAIRDRIAAAAGRAGRDPASVLLVAVSKTFTSADIRAAADLGVTDFGENKVQEAVAKMDDLADLPIRWHLVGHLQSNKARRAGARFDVVHSVDDVRLLERIDEGAGDSGRSVDLLVQVDLAGEATKHGAAPAAVRSIVDAARGCRAARLRGLMLLPPASEDPEAARPYFQALRRLRDRLIDNGIPPAALAELSMGMSQDFEIAIEEGATLVRIGSAIFGPRAKTDVI